MKLSPKEERCLKYLKNHKGITSLDAINKLGDTRLSATVFGLREKGFAVLDIWEEDTNRYGDTVRYKRYYLIKEV